MEYDLNDPRDGCGEGEEFNDSPRAFGARDDDWIDAGGDAEINRLESDDADDDYHKRELEVIEEGHQIIIRRLHRLPQMGNKKWLRLMRGDPCSSAAIYFAPSGRSVLSLRVPGVARASLPYPWLFYVTPSA